MSLCSDSYLHSLKLLQSVAIYEEPAAPCYLKGKNIHRNVSDTCHTYSLWQPRLEPFHQAKTVRFNQMPKPVLITAITVGDLRGTCEI